MWAPPQQAIAYFLNHISFVSAQIKISVTIVAIYTSLCAVRGQFTSCSLLRNEKTVLT